MRDALEGVRILDFSWAWAGPYATTLLALMGAEVIRVESNTHVDMIRRSDFAKAGTSMTPGGSFHHINLHKKSVTLNLGRPEAIALARRLVAVSDVVVENFRPGVMDKLGLGYRSLREVKPDLVMLSVSACGASGPERYYKGYAHTFAALSGLSYATGYPDGIPTEFRASVDLSTAYTLAYAIMVALVDRQQSGEGQQVDLAAREAMSSLIGDLFLEVGLAGRDPAREGNEDAAMAPHNCYPCRGEGQWVSIAVGNDAEWQAFCGAVGQPPWSREERFADALSRWWHREELDALIAEWTRERTPYEVVEVLQGAGVAAMPSFSSAELFHDPHVEARGCFQEVVDPEHGGLTVLMPPWHFSETPARVERLGPALGQQNEGVFRGLLGMPCDEYDRLVAEQVIY